jgi:hypothetical protein
MYKKPSTKGQKGISVSRAVFFAKEQNLDYGLLDVRASSLWIEVSLFAAV